MIQFNLALALCGLVCWIILQIPMPAIFKNIIMGIICVALVIWALQFLGFSTGFRRIGF